MAYLGYSFLGPRSPQTADLGQVLDRTVFAIEQYDQYLKQENISEVGDQEMTVLTEFMGEVMNTDPRFYDSLAGRLADGRHDLPGL